MKKLVNISIVIIVTFCFIIIFSRIKNDFSLERSEILKNFCLNFFLESKISWLFDFTELSLEINFVSQFFDYLEIVFLSIFKYFQSFLDFAFQKFQFINITNFYDFFLLFFLSVILKVLRINKKSLFFSVFRIIFSVFSVILLHRQENISTSEELFPNVIVFSTFLIIFYFFEYNSRMKYKIVILRIVKLLSFSYGLISVLTKQICVENLTLYWNSFLQRNFLLQFLFAIFCIDEKKYPNIKLNEVFEYVFFFPTFSGGPISPSHFFSNLKNEENLKETVNLKRKFFISLKLFTEMVVFHFLYHYSQENLSFVYSLLSQFSKNGDHIKQYPKWKILLFSIAPGTLYQFQIYKTFSKSYFVVYFVGEFDEKSIKPFEFFKLSFTARFYHSMNLWNIPFHKFVFEVIYNPLNEVFGNKFLSSMIVTSFATIMHELYPALFLYWFLWLLCTSLSKNLFVAYKKFYEQKIQKIVLKFSQSKLLLSLRAFFFLKTLILTRILLCQLTIGYVMMPNSFSVWNYYHYFHFSVPIFIILGWTLSNFDFFNKYFLLPLFFPF